MVPSPGTQPILETRAWAQGGRCLAQAHSEEPAGHPAPQTTPSPAPRSSLWSDGVVRSHVPVRLEGEGAQGETC